MSAENRLTVDQLDALEPGDAVTIESAADFGRRRFATGIVIRVEGGHVSVRVTGVQGSPYLETFRRRDGIRVGGLGRAELVNPDSAEPADREARRRFQRIDTAYREWARNRADMSKLHELQTTISECLDDTVASPL